MWMQLIKTLQVGKHCYRSLFITAAYWAGKVTPTHAINVHGGKAIPRYVRQIASQQEIKFYRFGWSPIT
jgi:hypothetical protein